MSLAPGSRLGTFDILAKLGEGGMGEVYRARDSRLDREVAIKVLPALFTSDPDRLARFQREARVLASLNHPNIATLYELASVDGAHALVMELVDGDDLSQRIAQGPLPLEAALAIARQIAAALEAAHDQGIVHRDLKPGNVKVRDDGTVKVLDFGLAKALASDDATASSLSNSPTLTARATQLGMILGTAAYMAPEQAKGRSVDRRADVWAFGVVLFEMLAGRRAFDGDDVSEVLASVLKSEPDWSALPADLPPAVHRLLRRCLEKDPTRRLRDVGEGLRQLDETLSAPHAAVNASGGSRPGPSERPGVLALGITAVAMSAIGFSVARWTAPEPPPPQAVTFTHAPTNPPVWPSGVLADLAISPDGKTVVYAAGESLPGPSLWARQIDQPEASLIRGTEFGTNPIVSPSGEWVAFINVGSQNVLLKAPMSGGVAAEITSAPSTIVGGAWLDEGELVIGQRGQPLHVVSADGGPLRPLTTLDASAGDVEHLVPSTIPGTPIILFVTVDGTTPAIGGKLAAFNRQTGHLARLGITGVHPRWLPTGHVVYASADGTLRAVGFDPGTMSVSGSPVQLVDRVTVKPAGVASFDIATNGTAVFAAGPAGITAPRTLAWVDRSGKETAIPAPPRNYYYVRISPDQTRLSLDVRDDEEDIWIWNLERESLERLTVQPGSDQYGLWTTKGDRLVFTASDTGRRELRWLRADGTGQPERLVDTSEPSLTPFPNAITPDDSQIIFRAASSATRNDLWVAPIGPGGKPRPLLQEAHEELNATLSPDGRWMAYQSDLSGTGEIYVRPFPNVDEGRHSVSVGGGTEPQWSPAGGEIFYLGRDGWMKAVPVDTRNGFRAGKPIGLFDSRPYFAGGIGRNYDASRDGRRFAMVKEPVSASGAPISLTIAVHWTESVRGRLTGR